MSPRQIVELDRSRVVMAFFVMVMLSIAVALWNDHRISEAKKDIARNTEQIAANHDQAIKAQDAAEAAHQACLAVGEVKSEIVAYLTTQRNKSYAYIGRIPGYTYQDALQAERALERAIMKFTPRPCPALPVQHG